MTRTTTEAPAPNFALPSGFKLYLGNMEIVDMLVREYIGDVSNVPATGDAAAEWIGERAEHFAMIFAGQNEAYEVVPGWNTYAELGMYAAKHLQIDPDQSFIEILRTAFMDIARRFFDISQRLVDEKIDEAQSEFEIDAMVEETVAALMGTWEVTYPPEESA